MTEGHYAVRVGVDIGGTFTDVVVIDPDTHTIHHSKTPTTPRDPSQGFITGIAEALRRSGTNPSSVQHVVHGSTVATNAILEGKGARLGLITTKGFRHILEIGRADVPGIFTNFILWQKPARIVALELVCEVEERVAFDGRILTPLRPEAVRRAVSFFKQRPVEAIAISLLHSYANPVHERMMADALRADDPRRPVCISSDVLPEYREFERTVTTALNAYVMPVTGGYLKNCRTRLADHGISARLDVVRSDGGIMSLPTALTNPIHTILSGPAGGVSGAVWAARAIGQERIITMDMGGTSTDVHLSDPERSRVSVDTTIAHHPVRIPVLDIHTIGAGGGSIGWSSGVGALRVGPHSAGAEPGPACYGQGGTEPTVTDANLVLGRIPPYLLGGEIKLDLHRAQTAIESIARPLGMGVHEAAEAMIRIVDDHMLGALRVISTGRGYVPSDFTLVAFGGCGPVHAADLCELLGITQLVIPPLPGVLSALGFLAGDVTSLFSQTLVGGVCDMDHTRYNLAFSALHAEASDWLASEGVSVSRRVLTSYLDLRYAGQAHELSVQVNVPLDRIGMENAARQFEQMHQELYGFRHPGGSVEAVTLRVQARGLVQPPPRPRPLSEAGEAIKGSRPVYRRGVISEWPTLARDSLLAGQVFTGPCLIDQHDSTCVIPPWTHVTVCDTGALLVRRHQVHGSPS